jgi:cytoskeleton protein RodZ
MNETEIVNDKDIIQVNNGPGDQLQAARILQGLSIEDVASRMHLSLAILQAIEENNFNDITAPIFVKGYLRAYSRLVSLNEDEMIQCYLELYSNNDPPINTTSSLRPEISSQNASIKWATYLVIIMLIALLSAWWWNKTQNNLESLLSSSEASNDVSIIELVTETETILVLDEPAGVTEEPVDEPVAKTDKVDNTPEVDKTVIVNAPVEVAQEQIKPIAIQPIVVATIPVEPEVTSEINAFADTSITEETLITTISQSFDASHVAPKGIDLLNIVVNADTWADIKDVNNHQLVYDLLRANRRIQIRGEAPFNAFFGNGRGVEVTFNDQPIDIASQASDDNTARLTIGTN